MIRSPSIEAVDRTVTVPLNATTSPRTVPEMSASPSKTTTAPVTVPAIVAGPWKIRAVSTVSDSVTIRWPESTIWSFVSADVVPSCAHAGAANTIAQTATPERDREPSPHPSTLARAGVRRPTGRGG